MGGRPPLPAPMIQVDRSEVFSPKAEGDNPLDSS
jgi:hypothetical protein